MMQDREIIRKNSRSFSLAASLLPRNIRASVVALYAWCRTVDDTVDKAEGCEQAADRLSELKADLIAVSCGQSADQTPTRGIAKLIRNRQIDAANAVELIEGMEMDLQSVRIRTDGDLRRYCYHAAGTVGLMMADIMGVRDRAAKKQAISLGIAMQMTNIARDVLEDADRGRSYLPRVDSPLLAHEDEVKAEVSRLLAMAESEYESGLRGIASLPRSCRPAIRVAAAVYREIGREILRQDCPVMQRRVVLPRWRLLGVAARAAIFPQPRLTHWFSKLQGANFMQDSKSSDQPGAQTRVSQAWSSVFLGLSLTAIMASVMFVLVYVNPKESNYGTIPLIYSGVSIVVAVIMNRMSVKFAPNRNESPS